MKDLGACPVHTLGGINREFLDNHSIPDYSTFLPQVGVQVEAKVINLQGAKDLLSASVRNLNLSPEQQKIVEEDLHRGLYFLLMTDRFMKALSSIDVEPELVKWVESGAKNQKQLYGVRDRLRKWLEGEVNKVVAQILGEDELSQHFLESQRMSDGIANSDLEEFRRITLSGFLDVLNAVMSALMPLNQQDDLLDRDDCFKRVRREIMMRTQVHGAIEEILQEAQPFVRDKKHFQSIVHDDPVALSTLMSKVDKNLGGSSVSRPYKVCAAFHLGHHSDISAKIIEPLFDLFWSIKKTT